MLDRYGISERFVNEALLYPDLITARVVAQHKGSYKIVTQNEYVTAEISGKFRHSTTDLSDFPTVGDFVMISPVFDGDKAIIHNILTRKSVFLRSAVGVSGQSQCVAANIDTVFICMSLNNNFNLSRLERYLSVAWDSNTTPVILLTKADLCDNIDEMVSQVERVSLYSEVITLSKFDNDIGERLSKHLVKGTTAAFIGSSGVGKSTLINILLGQDIIATNEVSNDDKGRHTTTGREMFPSPYGGVLIDTPGMRELGVESADLGKTFEDISDLAKECRFHDCTHQGEPGCAVMASIDEGVLDARRFENYMKIKNEAGYEGLSAKEIEVKKLDRMAKDVGGMKNLRRFAKEQRRKKY